MNTFRDTRCLRFYCFTQIQQLVKCLIIHVSQSRRDDEKRDDSPKFREEVRPEDAYTGQGFRWSLKITLVYLFLRSKHKHHNKDKLDD